MSSVLTAFFTPGPKKDPLRGPKRSGRKDSSFTLVPERE